MGELQVPLTLCGVRSTARRTELPHQWNPLPRAFIGALALVKQAAARANTRSSC